MKCVLHFSNGVFNSLAPVKRGDGMDQVEEERMDGERAREVERGVREARRAFLVSAAKENIAFSCHLPSGEVRRRCPWSLTTERKIDPEEEPLY